MDGSGPATLLSDKYSPSSIKFMHILSGRLPDSLFPVNPIFFKEDMLNIAQGIDPVRALYCRFKSSSPTRLLISSGIPPANQYVHKAPQNYFVK